MIELSDNQRALAAAFAAQKYQETGAPGMVLFVTSESDSTTRRHSLVYLDVDALAGMIKTAQEIDQRTTAFVLLVQGGETRTETVLRETLH